MPVFPSSNDRRVDVAALMTLQSQAVMAAAVAHAGGQGHAELDTLHLLHALTEAEPTRALLQRAGARPDSLRTAVDAQLPGAGEPTEPTRLSGATQSVLGDALRVARALGSTYIAPEHLLLALTASPITAVGRLLAAHGVTAETLQRAAAEPDEAPSDTPTLDSFGTDLTQRARDGKVDPVIGRTDEIAQLVEVLVRRTKNNPVLVGEAGVGKTAIAEGLAQRIVDGTVPPVLAGTRLVQLDLTAMLAGTKHRGDFEERMTKVVDEVVAADGQVLLFLDELHTVVGAGSAEGAMDAGNILKPKLARGELHLIGATTLDEYRRIERDPALERRFQPVRVEEPSVPDATAIIRGLAPRYAEHHGVTYSDEALVAAVTLSDRYVPDRQLPDKAIDLLDQAGARVQLREQVVVDDGDQARLTEEKDAAIAAEDYERAGALRDELAALVAGTTPEVTVDDVAEVVARATGVPAAQLTATDKARLRGLEAELHQRVVGQDEAVTALARAVRRSRSGLADHSRPVGSFLFLGPTGVGKTELAKALAGSLFGDDDAMVRLDMSEYGERHTVSRLVGSPPGYVGHEQGGQLTEAVRRRPYSVILLDEVEKAHPDVFHTLLQLLDDGRLTDGQGRTVDFSHTVLIMTSNLGSELIGRSGSLGFTADGGQASTRAKIDRRLREHFRPEFLNRIDETVVFAPLEREQLREITGLLLGSSRDRLAELGVSVEVSEAAVDWLAQRGHQPELGARPLRRTIQRELDDPVADLLLDDAVTTGDTVVAEVVEGELALTVRPAVALAA